MARFKSSDLHEEISAIENSASKLSSSVDEFLPQNKRGGRLGISMLNTRNLLANSFKTVMVEPKGVETSCISKFASKKDSRRPDSGPYDFKDSIRK